MRFIAVSSLVSALAFVGCGGGGGPAPVVQAKLAVLTISQGALSPAFDPATSSYAVGPAVLPSLITVTPTVETDGAIVEVNGQPVTTGSESPTIALGIGVTVVSIKITGPNGTKKTYTIAFDRTSAQLAGLLASAGALSPAFDPGSLSYVLDAGLAPTAITLTPQAEDPGSEIRVNGVLATSGAASDPIALLFSTTDVTVEVTARDGTTRETYLVAARRAVGGEEARISAANRRDNDAFGGAIAIDGDTIVVGAKGEDSSGYGGAALESGAAYVFVKTGSVWTQEAYLKASDLAAGDEFGTSVAISGDTLVVGAPGAEAAYVFVRSGVVWSLQKILTASSAAVDDKFGTDVSIDGDTLVVGAPERTSVIGPRGNPRIETDGGATYVFVRSAAVWTQQAVLVPVAWSANDNFGTSVGVSGNRLVAGAPGASVYGAAWVFVRAVSDWSLEATLLASDPVYGSRLGADVAISGDVVVLGRPAKFDGGGSIYVFGRNAGLWTELNRLKASNESTDDGLGSAVGISGGAVVGGAPGVDEGQYSPSGKPDSGMGYVFR